MLKYGVAASVGLLSVLSLAAPASAQWGTLKGQIILEGEVPEIKPLIKKGDKSVKDPEICAAEEVPDDSLLIGDEKGIANVAIWLVKKPKKIHPDLVKPKETEVVFDQVGCRFIPHMLVVQAGQDVRIISGDATAHNTRGNPSKNQAFNFIVAPKDRTGNIVPTKLAERLPVQITCDIHNWMKAYWVIVDHPYATVTDKDGKFEIKDIPAGEHEVRIWHENMGYVVKDPKNPKKAPTYTIKSGETTEIPVVKVPFDKLSAK